MKLKDTFTPGPWHANIAADSLRVPDGVASADGLHICDVASYGASPSTRHANALLIASAPELLEALEEVLEFVFSPELEVGFEGCEAIEKAKQAVKKAKGLNA